MIDNVGGISLEEIMAAAMGGLESNSDNNKKDVSEQLNSEVDVNTNGNSTVQKETSISDESQFPEKVEEKAESLSDDESKQQTTEKTKESVENSADFYGFGLETFLNNYFALSLLSQSYRDLREDINQDEKLWFESAVKTMAFDLFPKSVTHESSSSLKCSAEVDEELLELLTYGQYKKYLKTTATPMPAIFEPCGVFSLKNVLEYPIEFNDKRAFSYCISTDKDSREFAEKFVQYIIYNLASSTKKGDVRFRCADKEKGGQSYGKFISLISSNKLFGTGISSNETSICEMVVELNQIAEKNFADLKGQFKSVYDYNEVNSKRIPITLATFCDISEFSYSKSVDELKKLLENSQNSAISTVFLVEKGKEGALTGLQNQIHISFEKNNAFICERGIKLPLIISNIDFSEMQYAALEEKLNTVEMVDTDFNSHFDLNHLELFTRDATEGLKIPFAFDEDNHFVDLELGDATPHALLSGSTGSGKSVTLHSIINQAMINYHPDDVEIWAIDYKAVEFGCYVNKRTPHITVIGQDNSEDFTFGLIDLIKSEYDRRKNLFVENNCKDFKAYRNMFGKRSISRILIVVDEFHNMTQAIAGYMGEKDYKKILENLLSEMRAMGMSFLFCSQTIAAGLNGLTEKGRNQIGCRLSMKHQDITEIKETLSLSLSSGIDFESIKYLRQGELIYKKVSNKPGTDPYTLERVNVLFTEPYRDNIIDIINSNIEEGYVPR